MVAPDALPSAATLPISRLTALFRDTSNAYKYLYFLALLDLIDEHPGQVHLHAEDKDMAARVLQRAWYPHTFFRLSFGRRDRLGVALDELALTVRATRPGPDLQRQLKRRIDEALDPAWVQRLGRYVPTRLLRPFFAPELLRGLADHQIDVRLASLSRDRFDADRPVYRRDPRGITLHPDWVRYLRQHGAIVRGWALFHFTAYMQRQNPNVPAVSEKLVPVLTRPQISKTCRDFWRAARQALGATTCVYTQAPVPPKFALDHFLPWTFVVHNQTWNLIPIASTLNSSKGQRLPPRDALPRLVAAHAHALVAARPAYRARAWSTVVEDYVADLGIHANALTDPRDPNDLVRTLQPAYARTLRPLYDLARSRGFELWTP